MPAKPAFAVLALLLVAGDVRADASAPVSDVVERARKPLPPGLRRLMGRVRQAAAAHDVRELARLVDVEFTTGEELDRTASIAELRDDPWLLDQLVVLLDEGRCTSFRDTVQCQLPHARGSETRLAIFGRGPRSWRLFAFYGGRRG